MSDFSKASEAATAPKGLWPLVKKAAGRLQDWFVIQSVAIKLTVLVMAVLIPVSGIYSLSLMQKRDSLAEQVRTMATAETTGEGVWAFNDALPVVLGTGSMLGFVEKNPVERITVIYEPLTWNAAKRIFLIESHG